ncbi:MAG: radical SAM protein, partial [Myxococcota bacterium]
MEPIQPIRETHIPVFFRHRDAGRLDSTWDSNDEAPSVETVCELVAQAPAASSVIIGGGEPTLRTDLPKLLSSLERTTTLATDGLVFHKANTVQHLAECGLTAVRLPLHSARADAYDWLTGIPGSHRRIRQAVACCIGLGIDVTAEVTLTRPTMPYLEETVAWLLREGVTSIRFRMLRRRGPATMEYITLAPRFGLLEPSLDAAIQLGLRNGVHIAVEGLPHCAVPRFPETRVPSPRWIVPDGIDCPPLNFVYSNHCDPCEANCEGAPSEYVDLFGRTEFSLSTDTKRVAVIASDPPRSGDEVAAPPARAARVPAT